VDSDGAGLALAHVEELLDDLLDAVQPFALIKILTFDPAQFSSGDEGCCYTQAPHVHQHHTSCAQFYSRPTKLI